MKVLSILFLVALSSCLSMEPAMPQVKVNVDKELISQIDSILLLENSGYIDLKRMNSIRINAPLNKYIFYSFKGNVRIKLKLLDSKEILSDLISVTKSETRIKVDKFGDKIIFKED